ncbi:nucleotidyltransferase family protein [Prevotella sp. AGR2160]|uniref:nucleotidyltransferase family protein n=1 Tax=Prevotella sp. AGR2160 TaxID=1280674 RepID=UPI00055A7F9E|nr:nucleotidyltransferase domain-containing protein [Prevotella sp. AGR2160]
MMKYGLEDRYLSELREILASIPEIEEAILFGSRARGDYRRNSDIDLSLTGEQLEQHHIVELRNKLYESRIPYFFDINIFRGLKSKTFIENILHDGVIIYKK